MAPRRRPAPTPEAKRVIPGMQPEGPPSIQELIGSLRFRELLEMLMERGGMETGGGPGLNTPAPNPRRPRGMQDLMKAWEGMYAL